MLAKNVRFHGHGSLRFLYKNADTYRSRYFTLRITKNPRRPHPRCAVVVSKKIHKSAVGRNRMRRRVYELIRHELPQLNTTYDMALIITSAELIAAPHDDIRESLQSLLSQAGVYK